MDLNWTWSPPSALASVVFSGTLLQRQTRGSRSLECGSFFCFFQLIFEKEGVYLHTNAKKMVQDLSLPGFIRVVERVSRPRSTSTGFVTPPLTCRLFQAGVPALEWSPLEDQGHSAPAVLYSKKVRGHSVSCVMSVESERESDFEPAVVVLAVSS